VIALAALGWTAAPFAAAPGERTGAPLERAGWLHALDRHAGDVVSPPADRKSRR
jgi:hypothetical protein